MIPNFADIDLGEPTAAADAAQWHAALQEATGKGADALTWETPAQRNRILKDWQQGVFICFGEQPRAMRLAWVLANPSEGLTLVTLSGRGDKDLAEVLALG